MSSVIRISKVKVNLPLVRLIKAYIGRKGTALSSTHFYPRHYIDMSGQFHSVATLRGEKKTPVGGLQSRAGRLVGEKMLLSLPGFEPGPQARSLFTIQTTLSLLLHSKLHELKIKTR